MSTHRRSATAAGSFSGKQPVPIALITLLGFAIVFGGGGFSAAFGNLVVQLLALGLLAIYGKRWQKLAKGAPAGLVVLTGATCLLPVLQLIPLPPALWMSLPGRELIAQSFSLIGGPGWFSLSVDPARTLIAFLSLLAPLTAIVLGLMCDAAGLARVQKFTIAIGVGAGAFGTTHLISNDWGDLYAGIRPLPDVLVATFADRNAAALFLVACLLLLVGLPDAPRNLSSTIVRVAIGVFLGVCVLMTGSRTGMALLVAPTALLAWRIGASRANRLTSLLLVLGSLTLVALLAVSVTTSGRGKDSLDRFAAAGDGMRAEMRKDAMFAARRYWPAGSGLGTFDDVFQVDESLEYVSPRRAGRAHMDYLEVAIESGIAGVVLMCGWLAWLLAVGWRAIRCPGAWTARAAFLIGIGIAAQSLVLFPLRNEAMLCMAAFAIVLLVRSPVLASRESNQ